MLFFTCTDHISTMSPVSETQDYDYLHHVKGAVKLWSFRDDIHRIKSQKAIKCGSSAVNGCICEMLFNTNTKHTSIMSPELMKLRIMTVSLKTKVLIKFGTSEMMYVDLRAKKL